MVSGHIQQAQAGRASHGLPARSSRAAGRRNLTDRPNHVNSMSLHPAPPYSMASESWLAGRRPHKPRLQAET
eukprot:32605-Eustigmatos_ZCMA.PRE.1